MCAREHAATWPCCGVVCVQRLSDPLGSRSSSEFEEALAAQERRRSALEAQLAKEEAALKARNDYLDSVQVCSRAAGGGGPPPPPPPPPRDVCGLPILL